MMVETRALATLNRAGGEIKTREKTMVSLKKF